MATDRRITLGKMGEDLACAELGRRGYAILARGYRTRGGEVDIIARDGGTLVFVEVKTRASADYGGPAAAVTALKRRRLYALALDYIARRRVGWGGACRFDVVTVTVADAAEPVLELFRNAFRAEW